MTQQHESKFNQIKYRWIKSLLTILIIILLAIVTVIPGALRLLHRAEDGYTVEKFVYREGDYTVWYTLEPKSYTVYYEDYMAGKEE